MPIYGMGENMPIARSFGYAPAARMGVRGYGTRHLLEAPGQGVYGGGEPGYGVAGGQMGFGHVGYGHHGGYPMHVMSNHGGFEGSFGAFDAGHHEYGVEGDLDVGAGAHGFGAGYQGSRFGGGHLVAGGLGLGGGYGGHAGYLGGGSADFRGGLIGAGGVHGGIVGDYEGDRGALIMNDRGYGHGYGGPSGLNSGLGESQIIGPGFGVGHGMGGGLGLGVGHGIGGGLSYGGNGLGGYGAGLIGAPHGFGGYAGGAHRFAGHSVLVGADGLDGREGFAHAGYEGNGGVGFDMGGHGLEMAGRGGFVGGLNLPHGGGEGFARESEYYQIDHRRFISKLVSFFKP